MNQKLIEKSRARLLPLAAGLAIAGAVAVPAIASAAPASPATAAAVIPGEVMKLSGTPNLWVVDSQGIAHFASDPQVLAGKPVNWSSEVELTTDQLAGVTRGAPWLSMALVQMGDSIYLAEPGASNTPTSAPSTAPATSSGLLAPPTAMSPSGTSGTSEPALLHVASPSDLSLLGVTPENYGQLVLDRATWEKQYGISLEKAPVIGDFQVPPAPYPPYEPDPVVDESGD